MALSAPSCEDSVSTVTHNANTPKSAWNTNNNNEGPTPQLNPPFMADDSWPPLSHSTTRPSAKSTSPSPSPSPSPSSSVPQSQDSGSVVPSPGRLAGDNVNTDNVVPAPEKSFKRSYSKPSYNGGKQSQPSSTQGSMPSTGYVGRNSSPKDHQNRNRFVSNDHPHQRNSYRNRNGGYHHNNYGIRRDQDRGNHDWNRHPNFNGRDNYMFPRYGPIYTRFPPPTYSADLFPQQPLMQPFGGPIGYPELPPHMVYGPPPPLDTLIGVPYMPQPPIPPPYSMLFPPPVPPPDLQLQSKILSQIEYYFSEKNLPSDVYLQKQMDDQGWVPINIIAGFNRVKKLTDSTRVVLDSIRTSSVIQVQGNKVRRRNGWWRYLKPSNNTGSQTIGKLADQVQNVAPANLKPSNNTGSQTIGKLADQVQNVALANLKPSNNTGSQTIGKLADQVQNDTLANLKPSNNTGSQTIGKLADQVKNLALETANTDGTRGLDVLQNRPDGDLNKVSAFQQ